ncbi:LOW QUALITY PROTEIN: hypothetical protein DAPPUDRAFT_249453 [Daphnia pulex]|uniref:Uncharacterized protein n=1 Tax=Daphnia pulex TaxID=6669 RepID=E9GWP6_DAPPU|nr:LOW QUALITY PROTEIN: hypothetical protein DAPPUDRAFT_249453 [Daphnia pulex]|eukprot:EFX76141.1 LOW QUALITY PROTEIN: hypothetical protein DAPPUDRAFT_249453 [Daphnia pulex]
MQGQVRFIRTIGGASTANVVIRSWDKGESEQLHNFVVYRKLIVETKKALKHAPEKARHVAAAAAAAAADAEDDDGDDGDDGDVNVSSKNDVPELSDLDV